MKQSRRAFSLLVAIFTIVLISLVASYIFYASSSIAKEGGIQYQQEQAKILARSYTEYAILAISANNKDSSTPCIDTINANIGDPDNGKGYKIVVEVTYIGNQRYISKCNHKAVTLTNSDVDALSVILDVYVKYKDLTHPSLNTSNSVYIPWQVYHRRSLQKI